jgi:UDP-2-acetamido-2-deoxy-ribo-hexuluronate aminotransferase
MDKDLIIQKTYPSKISTILYLQGALLYLPVQKTASMKKIQMVDLSSQYQRIKNEVDNAISGVIGSAVFINGPVVKDFADSLARYLRVHHVIPCANGTDALQIAMMALDLKPGDEVILPAFTYAATAEVIALLKLKPVMVDVYPDTFLIDTDKVEAAITPRTKAIVPVHLFGQCADMDTIMRIADKHGIYVIEDTAQAIGAEYTFADGTHRQAGTIGHVGCTSFFPSKNLGCFGDGGAMYTNDEALAKRLKMIANHGQAVQYTHDEIGVNSRLDAIQAAVLGVKLKYLDEYAAARNTVAAAYDQAFAGHPNLQVPVRVQQSTHVFHQYTLKLTGIDRDALRAFLSEKGIPTMVYYPIPLHFQKAYAAPEYQEGSLPVTENLCKCVFSLPISTEMDEEQLGYITRHVLAFCKDHSLLLTKLS